MANYTPNLNLRKPLTTEKYDVVADLNDTKDKIDTHAGAVNAQLADMTYYVKPTGAADDTSYLQNILNLYPRIIIKKGTYFVNAVTRLKAKSNQHIEFEEGAILQALTNDKDQHRVLQLENVSNVTLVNPTVIGERDTHIGEGEGSGHGITMYGCKNIKIYNAICKDFWGDGLVIGSGNEDVLIDNILCDNNRRQGISLIGGKRVTIVNPTLNNTHGIPPAFGLDIEPTFSSAFIEDLVVINAVTKNNEGGGININLQNLVGTGRDVSITVDNHRDIGSRVGLEIYKSPSGISGTININNPVYKDNSHNGIAIQNCSAENKLDTKIINPVVINPNTSGQTGPLYGSGISIYRIVTQAETYLLGNVAIINPIVKDIRTPVKILRGIYVRDEKNLGCKNIIITNPLELSGMTQTQRIDLNVKGAVKVLDGFNVNAFDYSFLSASLAGYYSKVTNPTENSSKRTLTLNQALVHDYPITIQSMSAFGVKVVPRITDKILPLSPVAGKFIEANTKGASITLKRMSDTEWYVENMIGVWTVEP